jgi:hypothetical protein
MTAEAKVAGHQDVPSGRPAPAVMPLSDSGAGGGHDRRQQKPSSARGRPESFVKRYRIEIAASTSSVFSTLAAFPLDSVKTRMQTYQYRGFLDCVRHTHRTEHLGGFFRGVTAPMASVTLVRTVSFSLYQRAKHSYSAWVKQNFGYDILRHVNTPGTYPNLYSIGCFGAAGATAGSAITFLACPFELTKLSAQVSVLLAEKAGSCQRSRAVAASYLNKGTLRTMGNIMKHRGVWGLYTGFRLHLLRDTLGTSIYFMVYESAKQLMTTFGGDNPNSNKLAVVTAGGMCGLVSWAMICKLPVFLDIRSQRSLVAFAAVADHLRQIPSIPPKVYTREMRSSTPRAKQSPPRRSSSSRATCTAAWVFL